LPTGSQHVGRRRGSGMVLIRRTRCRAPLWWGAVLAVLVGAPFGGGVRAQASSIQISSIRFEGNSEISSDSLAAAIVNKQTRCRSRILRYLTFCAFGAGFATDERFLSARELPRDILRLRTYYDVRGFRDVQVDTVITRPDPQRVEIVFKIDEGTPVLIRELSVVGGEGIAGVNVGSIPLSRGDRYSRLEVTAVADTLTRRMKDQGYYDAFVFRDSDRDSDRPYEIDVTFRIDPGPAAVFGPVTLGGNTQLSTGVVRRVLPFNEGEPYSRSLVLQGQRNLYNIQLIQSAQLHDSLDATDFTVPVHVEVSEGDVHRVRSGGGMSTSDCVNAEGSWTSRNFIGGARRLQVRARVSNVFADNLETACAQASTGDFGGLNWLVSADFLQPWVFSQRFQFAASVFFERQSLQDVFVREAIGFDARLSRQLDASTRFSVFYRPELTELAAAEVFFCTSFLACAPSDISVLQGKNWLAPVGMSLVRDRSNDLLNPSDGYTLLFDYEHASAFTGSDFGYNRALAEASIYRPLGGGQVVAARISGGWVGSGSFGLLSSLQSSVIHPQKRFFAGGGNSVRGFAQNQLGPRVLTVDVRDLVQKTGGRAEPICGTLEVLALTCDAGVLRDSEFDTPRPTGGRAMIQGGVEYRFPLGTARLEGAAFVDVGKIWAETESDFASSFEVTPGFGLRYLSPIGPLRLDVGYRFQGQESLQVVTSQLRFRNEGEAVPKANLVTTIDGDFVIVDELAVLQPRVLFGPTDGFSFSRFQLHFSIGQAF
jgi:outer membrane protein insertion porin family